MNTSTKHSTSKSKDTTPARGTRVSQSFVFRKRADELAAIAAQLGLAPALGPSERVVLARQSALASDSELEAIAGMAEKNGGVLAGIPFDADLARETIAYAAASLTFEHALEQLLKSCRDERLRRRARVTIPANVIRKTVRVLARTALGKTLEDDVVHLRSLQPRNRRRKKDPVGMPAAPATPIAKTATRDPLDGSG